MKKMISIALLMSLAACSAKIQNTDDSNQSVKDSIKKSTESINSLYVGGQPGKISVSGIVVKKQNELFYLDDRLAAKQTVGKTYKENIEMSISENNKAIFSDAMEKEVIANTNQLAESTEFINLGCPNLENSEIEGLTEKTADLTGLTSIWAKKVFICGNIALNSAPIFTISAEELILSNSDIELKSLVGSLNIYTRKIRIDGSNKIETSGIDAVISVLPAPTINLSVSAEINGEGNLLLQSIGGNCISKKN